MDSVIKKVFLLGICLWMMTAQAQWLTSSNLPIVIISASIKRIAFFIIFLSILFIIP